MKTSTTPFLIVAFILTVLQAAIAQAQTPAYPPLLSRSNCSKLANSINWSLPSRSTLTLSLRRS